MTTTTTATPTPGRGEGPPVPLYVTIQLREDWLKKAKEAKASRSFRGETYTASKHCFVAQAARFTHFGQLPDGTELDFYSCGSSEILAKAGPAPTSGADLRPTLKFVGASDEDRKRITEVTSAFDSGEYTKLEQWIRDGLVLNMRSDGVLRLHDGRLS